MPPKIPFLQVSIIIVNYNVKLFLEQCLCSVEAAMVGVDAEVLVVDNNSTDDSVAYLQPKFPWVRFIVNQDNTGFGKANNQGLELAKGKYILFLNPDTLLPEDCLAKCLAFMEQHADAGALGIKMIDGSGHFLPESKRAFPSPLTSFFKLTGFSSLFPKSKLFARYHLGYLSKEENHEVDVLAGAFMLVQKKILDAHGAFDERFFMYGEDVDLSYRIQKAGFKNYYFADSTIVHFKGESTKKGSLNYVRMFYQAMSLFVKKHYGAGRATFFNAFIQIAIWLRAGLTAVGQFVKWIGLPLLDALIVLFCLIAVREIWIHWIRPGMHTIPTVVNISFPAFTLLFILTGSIAGLYDKWYKPQRTLFAMLVAIIINLAVYSLMSEQFRFSRGIILFGGILAVLCIILFRWILVRAKIISTTDETKEYRQTLVIASARAFEETQKMMLAAGRNERILGRIALQQDETEAVGELQQLDVLLESVPAKELIFCMDKCLNMKRTISLIQERKDIRYKFHYYQTGGLVGSDSKETSGETLLSGAFFQIAAPQNVRYKRLVDIGASILFILSFPFHFFLVKKPFAFFSNLFSVLTGKKTWVGYNVASSNIPILKPAIIASNGQPVKATSTLGIESLKALDYWYAKDYEWLNDVRLIVKGYRNLGGFRP